MKIEKKSKGWILEELEKKNECLDVDSFGGENPEDVEKQREENAKEINKRFKDTIKNGEKVTGEDFVESIVNECKEFKKEERGELGAFIEELKNQGIKHTISRSANEGYRWSVSYEKMVKTPIVEEKVEESRGGFVKKYRGCSIIETPSVFVCTNPHGTTIGESKTIPGCEGVIDAWCERHGIKESIEDTIVDCLVAFGVCEDEEDAKARVAKMSDEQKHNWLNSFSQQSKERLVVDSLQEDLEVEKDGKKLTIKKTNRMSPDVKFDVWCDNHHCGMFDSIDDAKAYIENEFTKECCEDVEDDLLMLDEPIEELPDAIPEEPIVVSTEAEDTIEPEVIDNGIYMSLSSELRDTLQDIENLKSLTVTLANEEGREDLINELNSIIDDRTIHVGILQGLMETFDAKVEPAEEEKEEETIEVEEDK